MHVAVVAFMPLGKLLFSLPTFCNLNMLLYTEWLLRSISIYVYQDNLEIHNGLLKVLALIFSILFEAIY